MMDNLLEKAETSFKECLRIIIQCSGSDTLESANTYSKLGSTYVSKGEYQKAIRCEEECLRIKKINLGDWESSIVDTYMRLGMIHDSLENYNKALKCYNKALSSYKMISGDSSLFFAKVQSRRGGVLVKLRKFHKSLRCYLKAIEFNNKSSEDEGHVSTDEELGDIMCSLGQIYGQLGNFDVASSSYENALSLYEKSVGKNHPYIAKVLHGLAILHIQKLDLEKAYFVMNEALDMRQKTLGYDNEFTGDSLFCIGVIYFLTKRYKESLATLQLAIHIHTNKRGPQHLTVANEEFYIGCIFGEFYFSKFIWVIRY